VLIPQQHPSNRFLKDSDDILMVLDGGVTCIKPWLL
jgi:hypothetical protein